MLLDDDVEGGGGAGALLLDDDGACELEDDDGGGGGGGAFELDELVQAKPMTRPIPMPTAIATRRSSMYTILCLPNVHPSEARFIWKGPLRRSDDPV